MGIRKADRKRPKKFRLGMVTARVFMGVLEWLGFVNDRTKGSHYVYEHRDGRKVTVPQHKGKCIKKGLFFGLLRRIRITIQIFKYAFLKRKEVLALFLFPHLIINQEWYKMLKHNL